MNASHFTSVFGAFEQCVRQNATRPFLRAPAIRTNPDARSANDCTAAAPNGPPGDARISPADARSAIEYTYGGAYARVQELMRGYAAFGLAPGDRVATAFDSRLDTYLHLLALNGLGLSIVPIMTSSSPNEQAHILGHSGCRLLVVLPEQIESFREIAKALVCDVVTTEELGVGQGTCALAETGLSMEAALLYTSGTTGKPKGCMLSNQYFLAMGAWYNGLGGLCAIDKSDRLLTPLPPNHMNALCTSFMAMLLCGGCVIQLDRFHPKQWWRTVREERATVIHCLGVMTALLLKLPHASDESLAGQVKFSFSPGTDPQHQGAFEARFGIPVIEAWAMTESGAGGITIAHEEPRHVGQRCIGRPAERTAFRLVDENDDDVVPGEPGELLVRARGNDPKRDFFSGYYKDEQATEHGWRGGWWHTGDVVREGDDGSLFFVDRRKNVIRRSGENISAVEVEAVLLALPEVRNCAACAVPDEIRGDEVFALVVLDDGKAAEPRRLFEHCMAHLSYFKVPGYFTFVDELPLTASQKLNRSELRAMARERLGLGDCTDMRQFKVGKSASAARRSNT